jgi:hypothetical protein
MELRKKIAWTLSCLLGALIGFSAVPATAQSGSGQWQTLSPYLDSYYSSDGQYHQYYPVHNHLLPSGKVMVWSGDGNNTGDDARLWDPINDPKGQNLTNLAKMGYNAFCSAHVFLANGQLLVAGGHTGVGTSNNGWGVPNASLYNFDTWTPLPDMNAGRWYPNATTLANGDVLVVSGSMNTSWGIDTLPQVYQATGTKAGTWRDLSTAQLGQDLYPMMFLAPNGKVVNVGPTHYTRYLDTTGTGSWQAPFATTVSGLSRSYGSAVMYDGKILLIGGADAPTNTVEMLDLNQATPAWRLVAPMSVARRQLNATLLPDGNVLVTGGTSGSGFNDATHAISYAELWNSTNEKWTTLAASATGFPRIYHSAAVLLPDGRVLVTGGNGVNTSELFLPPYWFQTRPTMSGAPSTISYGQTFAVQSPDAAAISKATLIRLTSVTHAFNENQRLNTLTVTPGSTGTLNITAPASGNIAPPGHYLLSLVNTSGVPSTSSIVQLGASVTQQPSTPAVLSTLSPNTATAGSAGFTLTITGSNFVSGATVLWNGSARTPSSVTSTQVTVPISSSDLTTAGQIPVTVMNPSPNTTASNSLTFTITAAPALKYTLTVSKSGYQNARSTVRSSNPAGIIDCGGTCSATFDNGASVTLTALPTTGTAFAGWGGACSGTGSCTVIMNANKTITASFKRL